MKALMILPIILAAHFAEASYDASIVTINKVPVIEIVWYGNVCHFPTTNELLEKQPDKEIAKAIDLCLHSK